MKEKNLIAKSIINSKSKEEVKKYLKDNISFSSGSFNNPLVSPEIINSWTYNNDLYNIISRTPYSKFYYTTQDIDNINAKAAEWTKDSSVLYSEVILKDVQWGPELEELPEGASSSGEYDDSVLIVDNYEKYYTKDGDPDTYYQVIFKSAKFDTATSTLPDDTDAEGEKNNGVLTEDNLGKYFYDLNGTEKAIQELTISPKTISTSYIYKRQEITQEDLDDLMDAGNYDEFLEFITLELRRHVEDSIIGNIIGGAFSQDYTVSKYERFVIGETNSNFTTVKTKTQSGSSDYTYITTANVQEMCDTAIKTNIKWLVIHPADFRTLMDDAGVYSENALATLIGVDHIFQTNLAERGKVVCLDPTQYVIKVKNEINIAYPAYEFNKMNMQYEINGGGIIKGLKSSAMLVGSLMTY